MKNFVNREERLLPLLHNKLVLFKDSVKVLNTEGDRFEYLCKKLRTLSNGKNKEINFWLTTKQILCD